MWEAWMDGGDETWTREWETWIDGCMGGWVDGWIDVWMEGGWDLDDGMWDMDGWMGLGRGASEGIREEWLDGWMDGWTGQLRLGQGVGQAQIDGLMDRGVESWTRGWEMHKWMAELDGRNYSIWYMYIAYVCTWETLYLHHSWQVSSIRQLQHYIQLWKNQW